jgi:hypothetical protein
MATAAPGLLHIIFIIKPGKYRTKKKCKPTEIQQRTSNENCMD